MQRFVFVMAILEGYSTTECAALLACSPQVVLTAKAEEVTGLCRRLRAAIAEHRVGDRPDRYEPRAKRRRANPNPPPLNEPRANARARLARNR